MTYAIAAITTFRLLGAGTGKMTNLVTFETFFAIVSASHVASSSTTTGITITSKMARTVAFVARGIHRHSECYYVYALPTKRLCNTPNN
uniref:Uncharacterized protein n=1 Tax=Haematobia irritans TaxID=7368 RepID=A0A1L8E762_HAEIR